MENKINIFSDNNNQSQENSDIMNLENKTLSELLHKKGINLKILARLFTTFSLPFLKMMALNEMIVKICKNLIRFDISKIFFEDYLSNILNCQKKIKQNIVDFLNLLYYPKKPKSKIFWKEVIWHQLELRYDINIPVAIKNDYQIPLNYLKQLLDSLGIEYTTSSNSNFKLMQVEDFRDMCFNLKAKPLELLSIDAFKLFNSPIIMENEYFQKQIYQIMGLDNEFHLKKMLYYQKNGDFKNIIENYSNLYYSIGNLKELKIIFNSYLALKDPHNALKILDKISEYTSLDYPKCHPYFLLNLWRLCEFYLKEGFEEETLFLTRKILNKFEKCLNLRGCFSWGVYDKILENFNAFNCNKEKMLCLEKICKFEKENLKSFTDLINIYISKGEKSKAIRIFDNLLKIIKKKREKFSKDNFNNLLELNSIFSNIEEENLSIECLRIIWLGLNNMNVSLNDFPIVFSNYLSRVFIITMQGFSKEKKKILKDILGFLKKKQKTIEEKIQLIIKNTKKLNYDEFLEYFKEILSRIISKQKIDSKNIDEEIIEGILLIVKEAL